MISVSERSLTSMQWSVYNEATKRTQYSTVPASSITAEAVTVGGFALLQEVAGENIGYQANALNQYAMLSVDDVADFIPSYDAAGNQTRVKTSTGIWAISYDAENRPTDFTSQAVDGTITTVHCEYDYMGRRATKQVTTNGSITLHQRYIYRGYLQIAALDLTRAAHPALWYITWDPTQPIATRPLAIQKDGTWYTYGWDLTKNICEVYGPAGYIRTAYTYAPYGEVTSEGDVTQPIQWSSEYNDTELGLIYYNYRHYNPVDGRWLGRDYLGETAHHNLYVFSHNLVYKCYDVLGLSTMWEMGDIREIVEKSYSLDFQPVEALQLEDNMILSLMGLKLNKTLTSYFYFFIMGASALTEWNHHVLFMHRHYLAGTGKDYTYMPEHIRPLKYRLKEGYDYGKNHNFEGPIRMKTWASDTNIKDEAYTLKDYYYIVGGNFDESCNFNYTVYIRDVYDFNFRPDVDGSYVTFDNFARLMGGVVPGFISRAKPFIVKGKKDDIYHPTSS